MAMKFSRKWDFQQGNRIVDTNALRDDTETRDLIAEIAALSAGSVPAGSIGATELDPTLSDPLATIAGLRTLGTGAQQAAPGNHTHAATEITGLAAVARTGSASDITTGTLPNSVLPPVAITETTPVASQAAMLALPAQRGDVAVRTDLNKSFILRTDSPTTLADWQELLTPTAGVSSVAGKTGVVTLVKADVGLGNVDNTADTAKPVSTAQQAALDNKADKTNPTLIGLLTLLGAAGLELGRVDGVASTVNMDFHTGATAVDYDTRIAATGGSGANAGGGLNYYAGQHSFTNGTASVTMQGGTLTATTLQGNLTTAVPVGSLGNAALSTKGGAEKVVAASGTAGAITFDAANGNWLTVSPTGAITGITINNLPASGTAATLTLEVTQGATAYAVTLMSGTINWLGSQPTQTANKKTVYTLCTRDAGASWIVSAGVTA